MNLLDKLKKKVEDAALQKEMEQIEKRRLKFWSTVPTSLLEQVVYGDEEAQRKGMEEVEEMMRNFKG